MMYFTFREMLVALLSYLAFGFFAGWVYECLRCLFADIGLLFAVVPAAWKSALLRDKGEREAVFRKATDKELPPVKREICGFVFTLFFGVTFLLLTYLALDGVFRLYMLAAALFSFAVFEKLLGIPSRKLALAGFSRVLRVLFVLLHLVFFPMRVVLRFFGRYLLSPICEKVRDLVLRIRNGILVKRKISEWQKSLNLCK